MNSGRCQPARGKAGLALPIDLQGERQFPPTISIESADMSDAILNIKMIQPRMLSLKQAAEYLGVNAKRFPVICSVAPTLMPGDVKLYDRIDLDKWVDQIKAGSAESDDEIIRKLG